MGGLWLTVADIDKHTATMTEKEKEDALGDQIRFRKLVLNNTSVDKKVLQLQCGSEKYNAAKLAMNLKLIIRQTTCEEPTLNPEDEVSTLRPTDKIKNLVTEAIQKRKITDSSSVTRKKVKLQSYPEIVGKDVKHKFDMGDGKVHWFNGKVLEAVGDVTRSDCKFKIKYDGEEEILFGCMQILQTMNS